MPTNAIILTCALVCQSDRYGAVAPAQETPPLDTISPFEYSDPDHSDDDKASFGNALRAADGKAALPTTQTGGASPATGSLSSPTSTFASPLGGQNSGSGSLPRREATNPYTVDAAASQDSTNQTSTSRQFSASTSSPKPATLMRSMLTPPTGSRLAGQPIGLHQVVTGAAVRWQQSLRIRAYWDLCSSVADYYLGLRELEDFRGCEAKITRPGAHWQKAETGLIARIDTAHSATVATQHRLASLIGLSASDQLPLPADFPHCGDYYSRYEEIFRGRPSAEAQELAKLLPMRFQELKLAASQVMDRKRFLETVARTVQTDDGEGIVEALVLLALERRAFVQIAKDYNRRIARYAELAVPGPIEANRLVAMLIRSDPDQRRINTATREPAGRQITAPENRQSRSETERAPNTFAGDQDWAPRGRRSDSTAGRDEAVVPASGVSQQTFRQEKSVLVNPPPGR